MTLTDQTHTAPTTTTRTRSPWLRFGLHYLEMVVAMALGMVLLAPVWNFLGDAIGWSHLMDRADLGALLMATDMTIAMAAWMRFRGHGWAPIGEMSAAMYAPFITLFIPLWTGLISGETLLVAGHALMLPAMAIAMLCRRAEYSGHHHNH